MDYQSKIIMWLAVLIALLKAIEKANHILIETIKKIKKKWREL